MPTLDKTGFKIQALVVKNGPIMQYLLLENTKLLLLPPGSLYISPDYGSSWTIVSGTSGLSWQGVSISASGQYQTAVANTNYIYISSDYGSTWTSDNINIDGSSQTKKLWLGVSISASGQYQTACANGNYIYISSNYGSTWTSTNTSIGTNNWYRVSISASGQYQTATAYNSVYISSNYGSSWKAVDIGSIGVSFGLSMSASGQYQTITLDTTGSCIYISSDYGNSWTPTEDFPSSRRAVSISASGQYQVSCSNGNNSIYISSNYGSTWSQVNGFSSFLYGVSISASGQYITVCAFDGYIWTCQNSISAGVVSVGNYSSTPTGSTGSIYYDTSSSGELKVYDGTNWSSLVTGSGIAGVTAVTSSGLDNGATLTSDSYLQLASVTSTTPGILTTGSQTFAGDKTFTGTVTGTTGTFTNSVTIGDASTDALTVNAKSTFGATASFNSYLIGTTGTFSKTVSAAAFNSASDYRVKENIQELNLNIYNVNPLRPVNYYNNKLNKLDIGFIAHEVQEYYPFLVSGEKDGEETQSLNYNGLIGILVKEIQELKERVKHLEDNTKNT